MDQQRICKLANMDQQKFHPLLRGTSNPLPHALNRQKLRTAAAICDALIPSLPLEDLNHKDPDEAFFYQLSASQSGTHTQVAGLIFKWLDPNLRQLATLLLWLLSTRIGTFLSCGSASVTGSFPFIQKFADLPLNRREKLLRQWSRSIYKLQSLFKLFKSYCLWSFYASMNAEGRNRVWEAIGYENPEPNGRLGDRIKMKRPLEDAVFDVQSGKEDLVAFLKSKGVEFKWANSGEIEINCDVIVVGSGSGGGVVAGELANRGFKVIVLEKGKYFSRQDLSLLEGPSMANMYEGGGLLSTYDGSVCFLAGSTVGGGSAVNWSASICTPDHVLDEWGKKYGLNLFLSEEYRSAMAKICRRLGVQAGCDEESFQNRVLRIGCEKLGIKVDDIPTNSGRLHNCGHCGFGCKTGSKQSTAETWLVDAASAGAIILASCRAEKILKDPNLGSKSIFKNPKLGSKSGKFFKAQGVIASVEGNPQLKIMINAKCTVVACGSFQTPVLLQRSGLKNPNIGRNLHIHPTQFAWGFFPEGQGPEGKIYDGGIMTAMTKIEGESGYGAILEVPALAPGTFAALSPWKSGIQSKLFMSRYSRTAHIMAIARDRGSGTVSQGKGISPNISYQLAKSDEKCLKQGIERALRILIAAGAEEVGIQHPGIDEFKCRNATEEDLKQFLAKIWSKKMGEPALSTGSAHQMGSCKMGVDPKNSAVDPKGECWEVSGLFVADASLFPTALGVNPMVSVEAIALCIAHSVSEHLRLISKQT